VNLLQTNQNIAFPGMNQGENTTNFEVNPMAIAVSACCHQSFKSPGISLWGEIPYWEARVLASGPWTCLLSPSEI